MVQPGLSMTRITASEKLILRHFGPEDIASIFANYTGDPESAKYLARQPHASPEQTEQMLQRLSTPQSLTLTGKCIWVIEEAEEEKPIGLLTAIQRDESMELHFGIGAPFRSKGYATQTLSLAARYFLMTGQAKSITSFTDMENAAAQRALVKAGFVFTESDESVYKAPQLAGEYRDVYRYRFMIGQRQES